VRAAHLKHFRSWSEKQPSTSANHQPAGGGSLGELGCVVRSFNDGSLMDEPVDATGSPCKVNADGKAIYICCPGCAENIAAEPQKYLAVLKLQGVDTPAIR
jgi:YHS domain-containing protein